MAFKDYLTAEGERMLAKAASGGQIEFTRLVMGSGYLSSSTSEKNVSEVVTPVKTLAIDSVDINGGNICCVSCYFTNEGLEEGFYFREKGLYVSDGTEEVLAIYGNAGSTAEYIDVTQSAILERKIRTVMEVSSDEAVNITLTGGTYAPAPIVSGQNTIDDFAASIEAANLQVGQNVIINGVLYTLVASDSTNPDSYYAGEQEAFDESTTVISTDGNTITTTYASGARVVTEINEAGTVITESVYNNGVILSEKYQTTISADGNTITESEVNTNE